jgi:hypothetical protein
MVIELDQAISTFLLKNLQRVLGESAIAKASRADLLTCLDKGWVVRPSLSKFFG